MEQGMRTLTDAQLDRVYAHLDNPTAFTHVDFRDLDALWSMTTLPLLTYANSWKH